MMEAMNHDALKQLEPKSLHLAGSGCGTYLSVHSLIILSIFGNHGKDFLQTHAVIPSVCQQRKYA